MPTIEVGDADRVFIVRREGPPVRAGMYGPNAQIVEVGPNDLVLTVQGGENPDDLARSTRVYVNGSQVGLLHELRVEAGHDLSQVILDFAIISPDFEGLSEVVRQNCEVGLNNLMRLLPVATIREIGEGGVVVKEHGALHVSPDPPPLRHELVYVGPRPTRFEKVLKELG